MAYEWLGGSIGKNSHESSHHWGGGHKDEYFDGDNLKAGYETRFLGNGDNVSEQGAVAVYTNDYDDMWDSYEPMRDKSNYGIFKVAAPQSAPAPQAPQAPQAQAPAPQVTPKPPVVLSDRAARAVAGTKAYENVMLPRQGDYTIKNDQSVVSDFENDFKLNLGRAKAPDNTKQGEVLRYANNYKKAVADTLVPSKVDNDYSLNISFATSGMQPGQAGQRGIQFT